MLGKPNSLRELVLVTQQYDNLYWERQEEWKLVCQRDNKPLMNANPRVLTAPTHLPPKSMNASWDQTAN